MKKTGYFYAIAISCIIIAVSFAAAKPVRDCRCNGIHLSGRVKEVNSHADFKVQVVNSHADIEVQKVKHHSNRCGDWYFVDTHANFTVQFVNSHADFKVNIR